MARARLLWSGAVRRLWRAVLAPFAWLLIRPTFQPSRLVIAPQDIRTSDPIVASDIYAGFFALGGKVVDAHGRSPFDLEPPSAGWAEALHGFGWLRHLRAADTSLARANAQALLADWLVCVRRGGPPVAWRSPVLARRLMSWLSQSPVILEGADSRFYRKMMRATAYQATLLRRRLVTGLEGEHRLIAALAVAQLGLCSEDGRPYRRAARAFLAELNRQVLADGGHVSRNPHVLTELLLDLLPLRQAYAARGTEVPSQLLNAVDRMMPMLRLFRHGDGSLALFNGMGVTHPDALATILTYDDTRAQPLRNATRSGYQRLEAGPSVLICDTGRAPPPAFAGRAHAGALSFEFSAGLNRIVVNCGRPAAGSRAVLAACRATAAHSTLTLGDTSSAGFLRSRLLAPALDGALVGGPSMVEVDRTEEAGAPTLRAGHDGYARFGWRHERRLTLAPAGDRLDGEDKLLRSGRREGPAGLRFALRFHLHPAARPSVSPGGHGIALALPGGERWLFETDARDPAIHPSIFFAGVEGPRPTEQVVIEGRAADGLALRWTFRRVA